MALAFGSWGWLQPQQDLRSLGLDALRSLEMLPWVLWEPLVPASHWDDVCPERPGQQESPALCKIMALSEVLLSSGWLWAGAGAP